MELFDLTGRKAIVTGGTRGLGYGMAEGLMEAGAEVVIVGSSDKVQEVAAAFAGKGFPCKGVKIELGNREEVKSGFAACVEALGGHLDILVNNAGITRDNLVMKMNDEEFDAVYETNLKGVFHTIHHTSRYFLKQKSGRIINISSVSGITGNAGQANYCAAKAGVIGLTKSVARELSSRGITANVVAPGMIETDMTKDLPDTVKENMLHNIPLGRIGKPEEIAAAVAFLASEEAGYITGQVLAVDGGMTM